MKKLLVLVILCLACFIAGAALVFVGNRPAKKEALPDPPALVVSMREVARLETLDVSLYKKVTFEPDPQERQTVWGELYEWAKFSVSPPRGKAIVFADVQLGIDFSKLDEKSLRVHGSAIDVVLPPLKAQVELKPSETEVVGSNLDSAQTALLFEKAKVAFEREVMANEPLKAKARASAERSVKALLITIGFREVRFVESLPATNPG